jgi:hypothetical protein
MAAAQHRPPGNHAFGSGNAHKVSDAFAAAARNGGASAAIDVLVARALCASANGDVYDAVAVGCRRAASRTVGSRQGIVLRMLTQRSAGSGESPHEADGVPGGIGAGFLRDSRAVVRTENSLFDRRSTRAEVLEYRSPRTIHTNEVGLAQTLGA